VQNLVEESAEIEAKFSKEFSITYDR
jgi:hypothetical protein